MEITTQHTTIEDKIQTSKLGYKTETIEENFPDAILGYHLTLIFSSFFFRYFRRKIVLLQSRAVVAYGCLFSDLRYNCNTCTQVAHTEIMLILRK